MDVAKSVLFLPGVKTPVTSTPTPPLPSPCPSSVGSWEEMVGEEGRRGVFAVVAVLCCGEMGGKGSTGVGGWGWGRWKHVQGGISCSEGGSSAIKVVLIAAGNYCRCL